MSMWVVFKLSDMLSVGLFIFIFFVYRIVLFDKCNYDLI